jgi:outer membrane protein assembly factor BamB
VDYKKITDKQLESIARYEKNIKVPDYLEKKYIAKIKEKYKSYKGNIVDFKRKRFIRRTIAVAAAVFIIVIFPIVIFNYALGSLSPYSVILVKGNVQVERNNEIIELAQGDSIYKDDTVITGGSSSCSVVLNDETVIWINSDSKASFINAGKHNTVIKLAEGQIVSSVTELEDIESYSIKTDQLSVSVIGTIFLVEAGKGISKVAVNKGFVDIEYNDQNGETHKEYLKKSEAFILSEYNPEKTEGLYDYMIILFNQFEAVNTELLKEKIETNIPIQTEISTEKIEKDEEIKYEWNIKKIYNGSGNNIINISVSKYYAIAQNLSGFTCFNSAGKQLWKKSYNELECGLFDTPAVIKGNSLVAAGTGKKLIVLNLLDGSEIKNIDMPGIISKYSHMTVYDDVLYMPFADGIYALNKDNLNIDETPVIIFPSPVALVKSGNFYYTNSFVTKETAKFDKDYNIMWNTSTGDRLFSEPVFTDSIILCTWPGRIIKLDYDGNILCKTELSTGFISKPEVYGNSIYILANSGKLMEINSGNLEILNEIEIDSNPNPEDYLYKSVVVNRGLLIIGSDSGEVILYNLNTGNIEKTFSTINAPINSGAGFYEDKYFIGNESGDVYLVELTEAD